MTLDVVHFTRRCKLNMIYMARQWIATYDPEGGITNSFINSSVSFVSLGVPA